MRLLVMMLMMRLLVMMLMMRLLVILVVVMVTMRRSRVARIIC